MTQCVKVVLQVLDFVSIHKISRDKTAHLKAGRLHTSMRLVERSYYSFDFV